jgi:putative hydrolase of the HAD superfamily
MKNFITPINYFDVSNMKYLIFDLDDTLYNPSYEIKKYFNERINIFIAKNLAVDIEQAQKLNEFYHLKYGLTGKGLEIEHGINFQEYLLFMHDINVENIIKKDPLLLSIFRTIDCKKILFSNSIFSHTQKVLKRLEIFDYFSNIFTIESFNYLFKPNLEIYILLLKKLNVKASDCYYFDDAIKNLIPAGQIGFKTVLVSKECTKDIGIDYHISDIHQLHNLWLEIR